MNTTIMSMLVYVIMTTSLIMTVSVYGKPMTSSNTAHSVVPSFARQQLSRHSRSLMDGMEHCYGLPTLIRMKHMFNEVVDVNDDGKATEEEVTQYLKRINKNIDEETVKAFITRRDINGNRMIDFIPEFVETGSFQDASEAGVKETFHISDLNDDGYLSASELINVGTAMGIPKDEANEMVKSYYMSMGDNDNDGRLSLQEYLTFHLMA